MNEVTDDMAKQEEAAQVLALIQEQFAVNAAAAGSMPLYQILAATIRTLILEGALEHETRLPTLNVLAATLDLSKGTITHAYKKLEEEDYLSLTQGRGSFVSYNAEKSAEELSRKDRAMLAIDGMLEELSDLNFSRREIQIFIDLKMREFYDEKGDLQVAILSNSLEERSILVQNLSSKRRAEFFAYSFDDFLAGQVLPNLFDVFISTEEIYHSAKLRLELSPEQELLLVVMTVDAHTVIELANLEENARLGVLGFTRSFVNRMLETCEDYSELHNSPQVHFIKEANLDLFLHECDAVLFPFACFEYLTAKQRELLDIFVKEGGNLLNYRLKPEKASLLGFSMVLEDLATQGKEKN